MKNSKNFAFAAVALATMTVLTPTSAIADEQEGGSPETSAESEITPTKGDIRLAKLLEGREASEPVSCIRFRTNDRLKVIDDTALVYGRGKTIYVNYTRNPSRIDDRDTMVSRRFGSQVCKTDIITKIDNMTGIYAGNVFLAEFIPYTRVKKDS